jgi:hypothetical protein
MQAYLQSVRCEYGNGKSVPGGQTNVELPAEMTWSRFIPNMRHWQMI